MEISHDFVTIVRKNLWISSPEYAGYLTKRSHHWRTMLFRSRAWQRKWVSLHGAEIVYMEHEPTPATYAHMKMRRAQITASTVIENDTSADDEGYHGFVVNFNVENMPEWHFRADSAEERDNWLVMLCQVHAIVSWMAEYERIKVLGIGGQGIVYELEHVTTKRRIAMKEIEIKNTKQMSAAIAEAKFLKNIVENVAHPNIMHIEKVFQVGSKFYLVFPLCTGGELYEAIVQRGHFSEHEAAKVFRDIISALDALRGQNILHLDIKPENILFESKEPNAKVLITDFGLSRLFSDILSKQGAFDEEAFNTTRERFLKDGDLVNECIRGTFGYMSPEIILMGYSSAASDVFAAGVVLYILLSGYPPFYSRSNRQVLQSTVRGEFRLEGCEWDDISADAKDLIRRMLVVNPNKRISTQEILAHPWIQQIDADEAKILEAMSTETNDALQHYMAALKVTGVSVAAEEVLSALSDISSKHSHLSSAISNLAGHVQSLKSERMAATMTKFMSAASSKAAGFSHLANEYLSKKKKQAHPAPTVPTAASVCTAADSSKPAAGAEPVHPESADPFSMDQRVMMVDSEIRRALASVIFRHFGTQGVLTIEQFLAVRKQFGRGNAADAMSALHASDIVLVQMIDRDGDGLISIDDLMAAFVGLNQRQDIYLRALFRVYTEATWYFGQHVNYIHALQQWQQAAKEHLPPPPSSASVSNSAKQTMRKEMGSTEDVKEESFGSVSSTHVELGSTSSSTTDGTPGKPRPKSISKPVFNPPRFITAKNVAAVFEQLGYEPEAGAKVFAVLCEALQRIKHHHHGFGGDSSVSPRRRAEGEGVPDVVPEEVEGEEEEDDDYPDSDDDDFDPSAGSERTLVPDDCSIKGGGVGLLEATGGSRVRFARPFQRQADTEKKKKLEMDVNDFIRAAQIDNVLVQVFFRETHTKVLDLITRAQRRLAEERVRQNTLPPEQRREITIAQIFEEDLAYSFRNVPTIPQSHGPTGTTAVPPNTR